VSGVILSGTTLYGTTTGDLGVHPGIIFKLQTDGSGFTTLHTFDTHGSDAGLLLAGSVLYGTTTYGGSSGAGSVFKMNVNGTGFTTLHSFSNTGTEGSVPVAPLLLIGNILYGTTGQGGNYGTGTIFRLNTDGTHFAVIYRQDPIVDIGYHPSFGGLAVYDNRIFGVMENDDSGPGSVFVSGPKLVNVQFGDSANPYIKTGLEAVGFTEGDFWNFVTYDDKDGGGFLLKSAPDAIGLISPVFVFADQDVLTQSSLISSDNLFNGFAYPSLGGDLLIEVDLPAGVFDIYAYNGSGTSTTFTLSRDGIEMGSGSTSSGYVEFADVHSTSAQTLILTCSGTAPICNGLQIVFYQ
jgi:Gloeo_Verruco repeat